MQFKPENPFSHRGPQRYLCNYGSKNILAIDGRDGQELLDIPLHVHLDRSTCAEQGKAIGWNFCPFSIHEFCSPFSSTLSPYLSLPLLSASIFFFFYFFFFSLSLPLSSTLFSCYIYFTKYPAFLRFTHTQREAPYQWMCLQRRSLALTFLIWWSH